MCPDYVWVERLVEEQNGRAVDSHNRGMPRASLLWSLIRLDSAFRANTGKGPSDFVAAVPCFLLVGVLSQGYIQPVQ